MLQVAGKEKKTEFRKKSNHLMMFVWIKMLFFISNTSPSLIREPGECCEDMLMVRH